MLLVYGRGQQGHRLSGALSYQDIVRLEAVDMDFGTVKALRGIDLRIGRNEIVGLIGDNGAGKSTLIKVMTGVLRADRRQALHPRPGDRPRRLFGAQGARALDRDRLPGQVARREAAAVAQLLRRPADHQPLGLHRRQGARRRSPSTSCRSRSAFAASGSMPKSTVAQAFGRRAPGRRDRPRDAFRQRPDRARRADRGAGGQGGAGRSWTSSARSRRGPGLRLHRAQPRPRPRAWPTAWSSSTAARSSPRCGRRS